MNCYKKKYIQYNEGIFDKFVDATYVLTTVNSKRDYVSQLDKLKPTKKNIVVVNQLFTNCDKYIKNVKVDSPPLDIVHSYNYIFNDSLEQGYNHILLLEDDFTVSENVFTKNIVDKICNIVVNTDCVFYLGCIPVVSTYYNNSFRKIVLSLGTHANIYNINSMKRFINDTDTITGVDVYMNSTFNRIMYKHPLVYQTFPETDNRNVWSKGVVPTLGVTTLKLLKLDERCEPGTSIVYFINRLVYDFILPVIFLINIYICTV